MWTSKDKQMKLKLCDTITLYYFNFNVLVKYN